MSQRDLWKPAQHGSDFYALTLWQPWAHAMCSLGKRIENRPWAPPAWLLGQRLAIHAGATMDRASFERLRVLLPDDLDLSSLPRKAVVATCRLVMVVTVGTYDDLPEDQRRWFVGPYGWLVDDLRVLSQPVPCRGFQKLWRMPEDVRAAVEASA